MLLHLLFPFVCKGKKGNLKQVLNNIVKIRCRSFGCSAWYYTTYKCVSFLEFMLIIPAALLLLSGLACINIAVCTLIGLNQVK